MKHSDLKLDTVYANHDGTPLVLVSLEKFAKPSRGYGTRAIRPQAAYDKSFGVVAVRRGYMRRTAPVEELLAEAARLREDFPEKESSKSGYDVVVQTLGGIIREWDDQLIVDEAERERTRVAAEARQQLHATRSARIERIKALLPEGASITTDPNRDWVTISHSDLLAILER